ncbi:MAG: VOC family protein [Acidimicrobiales bacterium]
MGFHHLALATTDMAATHAFYTEAMGFELAKAVVAPTDAPGGWAKHLFYDTGGDGMIAFWDLHDPRAEGLDPRISEGLGLPVWVNHFAFAAADLDDLATRRERWLDRGIDVMEIDHGFCTSIYTTDPNGILVEWCTDTKPYTDTDRREALALLEAERPALEAPPEPVFHRGRPPVAVGQAGAAPAVVPAT